MHTAETIRHVLWPSACQTHICFDTVILFQGFNNGLLMIGPLFVKLSMGFYSQIFHLLHDMHLALSRDQGSDAIS
tara:strand:- start:98 stop:322 length:225 start_codon:yes stop_codon:yes gene_type:complete